MLKDLQNEKDDRNIFISNIGICDYKLPITLSINNKLYHSICNISSNVSLEKNSRGAHLSRIIEVLNDYLCDKIISLEDINEIINTTIKRTETNNMSLTMDFDIILKRISPISKKNSYFTVNLKINNSKINDINKKSLSISIIGTMLCPCSKDISKYGAHNQKCKATIILHENYEKINLEEIINIMEKSFSSNVYSTVKRTDEKYITELAYENPKFSEDLIRDLLLAVAEKYNNKIEAELINYESIHEHNVYAHGIINNEKKLDKRLK